MKSIRAERTNIFGRWVFFSSLLLCLSIYILVRCHFETFCFNVHSFVRSFAFALENASFDLADLHCIAFSSFLLSNNVVKFGAFVWLANHYVYIVHKISFNCEFRLCWTIAHLQYIVFFLNSNKSGCLYAQIVFNISFKVYSLFLKLCVFILCFSLSFY